MKNPIWKSRSSALLYIFHYAVLLVIAIGFYYVKEILAVFVLVALFSLMLNAKTMRYELSEKSIYFSASLLDKESANIMLKDIVGFYVIDEPPWSFFSLGTVLLVTDFSEDEHPCIKCIKNPEKLAELIKYHALKQGAEIA